VSDVSHILKRTCYQNKHNEPQSNITGSNEKSLSDEGRDSTYTHYFNESGTKRHQNRVSFARFLHNAL